MPLGIDATIRYGLNIPPTESIRQSHLDPDSPYNTRLRAGLPPTPIANPGLAVDPGGGASAQASTTSSSSASPTARPLLHRQRAEFLHYPRAGLNRDLASGRRHLPAGGGSAARLPAVDGTVILRAGCESCRVRLCAAIRRTGSECDRIGDAAGRAARPPSRGLSLAADAERGFAARGLDWAYVALDVAPADFETALRGIAAARVRGRERHRPAQACRGRDPGEADAPSVNTLVFDDGRASRLSTDAAILDGVAARAPVVIGDGGAARAFGRRSRDARVFSRRGDWPPEVRRRSGRERHAGPDEVLVEVGAGQTLVDLPYPGPATAAAPVTAGAT